LKKHYKTQEEEIRRKGSHTEPSLVSRTNAENLTLGNSKFCNDLDKSCVKTMADSNISTRKENEKVQSELKNKIEKLTDIFNHTVSLNKAKRSEINTLRKERNMFDQIFKNIEYQICDEEKQLFKIINKHQELEVDIKATDEHHANIMETVSRATDSTFYSTLKTEQKHYRQSVAHAVRQSHTNLSFQAPNSAHSNNHSIIPIVNMRGNRSPSIFHHRRGTINRDPRIEVVLPSNLNENRILLIETLIQDFKLKTSENKWDDAMLLFQNGKDMNAQLYLEYLEKEEEV
jgi:hypothetical protein